VIQRARQSSSDTACPLRFKRATLASLPGSIALSRFWASERVRVRCSLQRASGIAANTISIGSIGSRYFGLATGPLFRSIRKGGKVGGRLTDQSVADIVKAHAKRVGLDPSLFAGHSLRAGFLTSAAKRGASIFKMMDVSRHRSVDTLRGYVRDAEIFKDHAGAGLL
jgi:hypothetical protein